MTEEKKQSLQLISRILCTLYDNLYSNKEVFFILQDIHGENFDTIVKTVEGVWFGITRFKTQEEKASVYFCLIIKNHPVVDGNKRLAVLWLELFCKIFNLKIDLPKGITLDVLAVSIEQTKNDGSDSLYKIIELLLFNLKK